MNFRILALSCLLGVAAACSARQLPKEYIPHQVIVGLKPGHKSETIAAASRINARVIEESLNHDWLLVQLPNSISVARGLDYFDRQPSTRYADANGILHADFIPNDTNWGNQYGPRLIDCPNGWDIDQGGSNIVVAIIDTGTMMTHSDLASKIYTNVGEIPNNGIDDDGNGFIDDDHGWNFNNNNRNAADDNGHGTHTSGIACAATNNANGIAGVGFNCVVMPIKVLNSGGSGSFTAVANGINYAWRNGAKVLSMSLGGSSGTQALSDACNAAWNNNCIICASAGNNGNTSANYPAFYSVCIAIASVDSNDFRSSFSEFGTWVDVAAPGGNVYSTWFNGGYMLLSGTSMSCPHVAGQAALLWHKNGVNTSNQTIRDDIEQTTDNNGRYGIGNGSQGGRVNVFRSLQRGGAQNVNPTNFDVFRGVLVSGGLAELLSSDDQYVIVQNGVVALPTEAPITVRIYSVAPGQTASDLKLLVENKVSINGLNQFIDAFNFTNGVYDNLDTRAAPQSDTVITSTIANPNDHIEAGTRNMAARIRVKPAGPVFSNTWTSSTDQVLWQFTP